MTFDPRTLPTPLALVTGLLLAGVSTSQGECLDQSYLPSPQTNGLEITSSQPVTQTFTVGLTGQLTTIEIARITHHRGTPTQPLQFDLVTTDPMGVPTTTSLASTTFQPASVPSTRGSLVIDLRPLGIGVQSGDVLGIALSSTAAPGGQTYGWWGEAPNGTYSRGQVFIRQTTSLSAWDLSFQSRVATPAGRTGYGTGHPGTNGVPSLTASANPVIGSTPVLLLGNSSNGSTLGALFFGFARASQPTPFGGTALLQPVASVTLSVPQAGAQHPLPIPNDPGLCEVVVDVQGVLIDAGASQGVAFSPGLELVVGW